MHVPRVTSRRELRRPDVSGSIQEPVFEFYRRNDPLLRVRGVPHLGRRAVRAIMNQFREPIAPDVERLRKGQSG